MSTNHVIGTIDKSTDAELYRYFSTDKDHVTRVTWQTEEIKIEGTAEKGNHMLHSMQTWGFEYTLY